MCTAIKLRTGETFALIGGQKLPISCLARQSTQGRPASSHPLSRHIMIRAERWEEFWRHKASELLDLDVAMFREKDTWFTVPIDKRLLVVTHQDIHTRGLVNSIVSVPATDNVAQIHDRMPQVNQVKQCTSLVVYDGRPLNEILWPAYNQG